MSDVLPEGSKFGSYVVGECIGRGGMARIYRAEHEGLRRHVALKVLNRGFAHDREGHQRFLREARIAAAIKHPNVVNIFDVGVQDSVPYLVMELLEGADLESMMRGEGGALSEASLVDIIVPIVAGLSAVHEAGFVHRDLKPGNIFVARGRNDEIEPKLLDFGISKAAESEPISRKDPAALVIGTPRYMSPEAVRGEEITALSDQYSLGVVLYECSTGFNPFAADSVAETIRRVTSGSCAPPSQYNPMLSRRVVKIIQRAMSVDPRERFTDLREMGRELLSMAGQRTQIAWSLSFFGEVATVSPIEKVGTGTVTVAAASEPRVLARRTVTPRPSKRRSLKQAAPVMALFGVLTLATAAVVSWSSVTRQPEVEAHALRSSSSAARPPAQTEQPAKPVLPSQKSLPTGKVPELTQPGSSTAGSKTTEPSDRRRAGNEGGLDARPPAASAERDRARVAVPQRNRSARPSPPAPSRAEPRAQTPLEPVRPDWLIPADPKKARQRRSNTMVGTNGAPILE